jgi:hypothetical protein
MSVKGQRSHLNDPHMKRDHELSGDEIRNEAVHHEEGDMNVSSVYQFLLWLFVGIAIIYGIVFGIMKWNDARIEKINSAVTHLQKSKSEQLPPEPRLQLAPGHTTHPLVEGQNYRDSVAVALNGYSYINKATGDVRIPIERAKELLVQRGFAVRAQNQQVPALMVPNATSSGRTMIARDQRVPGGTFTVTGGNMNVKGTSAQ